MSLRVWVGSSIRKMPTVDLSLISNFQEQSWTWWVWVEDGVGGGSRWIVPSGLSETPTLNKQGGLTAPEEQYSRLTQGWHMVYKHTHTSHLHTHLRLSCFCQSQFLKRQSYVCHVYSRICRHKHACCLVCSLLCLLNAGFTPAQMADWVNAWRMKRQAAGRPSQS